MAMTLIDAPAPIQATVSDIISIRCEDYVGPARGTLTTASDGDSVAGTVVVDTQAIAVATAAAAQSTRFGLASDSVVIPWTDISALYPSDATGVWAMVGYKVVGDAPTNAQFGATFYKHTSAGLSTAIGFGRGTTHQFSCDIDKSVWGDQYHITPPSTFQDSQFTGTNLVIRAWGITGGTIEIHLDVVYLIPFGNRWTTQFTTSVFIPTTFNTNGTMVANVDVDDTDNVIGKFSVTRTAVTMGSPAVTDAQEANDEPTAYNVAQFIWNGGGVPPLDDPPSYMAFAACPVLLPAQTILTDSFPNALATNATYLSGNNFTKTYTGGNFTGILAPGTGFTEVAGQARARLVINQGSGFFPRCDLLFGRESLITGGGSDPDDRHPVLTDLECNIQEFIFETSLDAIFDVFCGIKASTVSDDENGLLIRFNADATMNIDLISYDLARVFNSGASGIDRFQQPFADAGGPVLVTSSYSPGQVYRVVVERRRYLWRAKVWLDGDPDPGWMIEGHESFVGRNTANTIQNWIDYEYDTDWKSNTTDHDVAVTDVFTVSGYPKIWAGPGVLQPEIDVFFDDYELTVDPDGSSPSDMGVEEEKYDGSVTWGSTTVPFPSWRIVDAGRESRTFDNDSNGFNIRAWKDPSAPELQSSCISRFWFKGLDSRRMPQIYRRVHG